MNDIVIHPTRGKKEKKIPAAGILCITPQEMTRCVHTLDKKLWSKRFLFNATLLVNESEGVFVAGPAIGAPMAAIVLEKLIVLGAESVVVFGWCAALDASGAKVGDLVLCNKAVSGEGTSQYYLNEKIAYTESLINKHVLKSCEDSGLEIKQGCFWSTDGLYRESRKKITLLARDYEVSYIDMEIAALLSVSIFRSVALTGLFVVSDVIHSDKWQPGFSTTLFQERSVEALNTLLSKFSREEK